MLESKKLCILNNFIESSYMFFSSEKCSNKSEELQDFFLTDKFFWEQNILKKKKKLQTYS